MPRRRSSPSTSTSSSSSTRPITAMQVDYRNGTSTGLHAHPHGQLLYAIAGVMIVRSAAGAWVVPPNRAVWLAAGLDHEVSMCGDVRMRTVFVDPRAGEHLPKASCVISVSALLRELIVAAVEVRPDYERGSRDERLMLLLLDELRKLDVLPLHLPMPRDRRIRRICDALMARPDNVSTASQWAERLQVAPKTIHRLFTKETGLTFAQWRQQARLLAALERLARGSRIIDVAIECGYANQSAFTAMFRKHFGMPPSQFYR